MMDEKLFFQGSDKQKIIYDFDLYMYAVKMVVIITKTRICNIL